MLAGLALGLQDWSDRREPSASANRRIRQAPPVFRDLLTPGPRPVAAAATPLASGQTLSTAAGERRRAALPDGSVLYLNQNTTVRCEAGRRVALQSGEVYVEAAPRAASDAFTVQAAGRAITALGTKFVVRADASVAVTQGQAQVSGHDGAVAAGQQLAAGGVVEPTPRATALLGWARDLMADAEGPLLPPNPRAAAPWS